MLRQVVTGFLRGLAIILPIGLTLYFFYFVMVSSEALVGGLLQQVLPEALYFPGLGVLLSLIAVTAFGWLVRLPGMGWVVQFTERMFASVPLVKTVFSTLKDFTGFLSNASNDRDKGQPVRVQLTPDIELIGVVTNSETAVVGGREDQVLVYLPMSYQLGGYTVLISKDKLTNLDMSLDKAMSFVVTAGVKSDQAKK